MEWGTWQRLVLYLSTVEDFVKTKLILSQSTVGHLAKTSISTKYSGRLWKVVSISTVRGIGNTSSIT